MTGLPDFSRVAAPRPAPPAAAPTPVETSLEFPQERLPQSRERVGIYDPQTRQQLQQIGWSDGDPVPSDLPKVVEAAIAKARQDVLAREPRTLQEAHGLPDDFKPDVAPIRTIADLPPEQLAELRDYMAEFKRTGKTAADRERAAMIETAIAQQPAGVGVPPPTARGVADWEQQALVADRGPTLPRFDNPAPPPPPPTPAETPKPAADEASTFDTRCPHCNHRTAEPVAEPTDEDVASFLAQVAGGRFIKQYELFGGKLFVAFRTLLTAEERMIDMQMRADCRSGHTLSQAQYITDHTRYRLALSIAGFGGPGYAQTLRNIPPIAEIAYTADPAKPERTALTELANWVDTELLPQSIMMSAVTQELVMLIGLFLFFLLWVG